MKCGSNDSVSNPCAMVPPYGPLAARSGSTWIHWWSSVASANWSTRAWSSDQPVGGTEFRALGGGELGEIREHRHLLVVTLGSHRLLLTPSARPVGRRELDRGTASRWTRSQARTAFGSSHIRPDGPPSCGLLADTAHLHPNRTSVLDI